MGIGNDCCLWHTYVQNCNALKNPVKLGIVNYTLIKTTLNLNPKC